MQEHEHLWQTLESAGVTIVINSPAYCTQGTAGAYNSYESLLFVCQQNAKLPYKEVDWTDFDLDTLRHEAHHVVQDCLAGNLGDNDFDTLFPQDGTLKEFVTSALTKQEIKWVIAQYGSQAASDEEILIELEAFAAAKTVNADTISDAVLNQCNL